MSDRELATYRRLARANPEDVKALTKYINCLERAQDVRDGIKVEPRCPEDPIQRHIDLAMTENGIITSLDELKQITTIDQMGILVAYLFPFGGIQGFAVVDEGEDWHPEGQDYLRVYTGIESYRDIPPTLEAFFGYGGSLSERLNGPLQKLVTSDLRDPIIWYAPFKPGATNQDLIYWTVETNAATT